MQALGALQQEANAWHIDLPLGGMSDVSNALFPTARSLGFLRSSALSGVFKALFLTTRSLFSFLRFAVSSSVSKALYKTREDDLLLPPEGWYCTCR